MIYLDEVVLDYYLKRGDTNASVCPTKASDTRHFTDDQIEAQMEALFCEV